MTAPVAHSESVPESLTRLVMSHLREIPDFPEPGVLFRDITPLLADGQAFAALVEGLADHYRGRIDAIAGLESRGFILGAGTLRDIALTLFIGMIAGTLSSIFLATPLLVDLRSREKRIKDQAAKVAAARQYRRDEAGDDAEELAKIDAAPAASPVTPGHHLGVAAQPKRKKKRR